MILLGENMSILSHDIYRQIRDNDPPYAIHYLRVELRLSPRCRFEVRYSFPSYLLILASELSGDKWVHSESYSG